VYWLASIGFGVLWSVVLHLLPWSSGFLGNGKPLEATLLFIATSLVVAIAFRGPIVRASSRKANLLLGALLPYCGTAVFLSLWLLFYGGFHEAAAIFFWGFYAALALCWAIVPMGLLCQYVMNRVGRSQPDEA